MLSVSVRLTLPSSHCLSPGPALLLKSSGHGFADICQDGHRRCAVTCTQVITKLLFIDQPAQ